MNTNKHRAQAIAAAVFWYKQYKIACRVLAAANAAKLGVTKAAAFRRINKTRTLFLQYSKQQKTVKARETVQMVKKSLAFYGFISCPLSDARLLSLALMGLCEEDLYNYACDYSNGFSHRELRGVYF
jgi:hypothetical protein